ncbi:MAG: methyltransferase [Clostridia bacterium]|nr:methyltransferase [Clostridia bacterium]
MSNGFLLPGEHTEDLGGGLKLIVSQTHTFGTDALLLAAFAAPSARSRAADLGTGCGIIPFYWLRDSLCDSITAVDIQSGAYSQLERSVRLNSTEKITPLLADLRDIDRYLPHGGFDLVTMNPPYTKEGGGIISSGESDKIARHGTMCDLDDVAHSAAYLLKFGGRLCVCIRPERMAEMFAAMSRAKIEPKRLRLVSQRDGCAPWLCLIEGKYGRRPGLVVERELHIENSDGNLSDEMKEIIGEYAD